jgi:hypothetical protein
MTIKNSRTIPGFMFWSLVPIFYLGVLVITSLKMWTITEDYSSGDSVISLDPNEAVQQIIIPRHPGLFRIDIYLAKVRPQVNGFVHLSISDNKHSEIIITYANPPASTSQYVIDGTYPFMLSSPINAVAQPLILTLITTEGASMSTLGTATDIYPYGQLLSPSGLLVQDLSFRLYYRPGILYTLQKVNPLEALVQLLTKGLYVATDGPKLVAFLIFVAILHVVAVFLLGLKLGELY